MVLLWFNLFCLGLNWKIIRLVFLTLMANLFGLKPSWMILKLKIELFILLLQFNMFMTKYGLILSEFQCYNAHVVVELLCGCHPTGSTFVVWSWRLIDCFALTSAVRGFWDAGVLRSSTQRLCHAGGPQWGRNSCMWLPLPAWYGCAHALGTGLAVGWCMWPLALISM